MALDELVKVGTSDISIGGVGRDEFELQAAGGVRSGEPETGLLEQRSQLAGQGPKPIDVSPAVQAPAEGEQSGLDERLAQAPACRRGQPLGLRLVRGGKQERPGVVRCQRSSGRDWLALSLGDALPA